MTPDTQKRSHGSSREEVVDEEMCYQWLQQETSIKKADFPGQKVTPAPSCGVLRYRSRLHSSEGTSLWAKHSGHPTSWRSFRY